MDRRTIFRFAALAHALFLFVAVGSLAQAPAAGKIEKRSIRVGELERTYLLYVPAKVKAGQPLLLALHGTFGNGESMRSETDFGFERLANEQGFVIAYPDAVMNAWNDCRRNNATLARAQGVDDVAFLREVIRATVAQHGRDPARVYLFGFSGGAHMAYRMAWESPGDVAAVASVGGNLPPQDALTCMTDGRTPRILLMKGRADAGDPFDGGPHAISGSVLSARETAAAFARRNGLGNPTPEVAVAPKVTFVAWPASGRHQVGLYAFEGIGHMVPIPWRDNIDGPALAWKFFAEP